MMAKVGLFFFSGDGLGVPGRGVETGVIATVSWGKSRARCLNTADDEHWLVSREVSLELSKGFVKSRSSLRGVIESCDSECELLSTAAIRLAFFSSRYLKNLFGETLIFGFFFVCWVFIAFFLAVRMGEPGSAGCNLTALERVMTILILFDTSGVKNRMWVCRFKFYLLNWFKFSNLRISLPTNQKKSPDYSSFLKLKMPI